MNSFVAAEQVARLVLSAAIQSPTPATLAILDAIPHDAFKHFTEVGGDVDAYVAALMLDEGEEYAARLIGKYGTDADPWRLEDYADDLKALSGTKPEEPEAAPKSALPPLADLMKTWDLADEEVPMLFRDAMPLAELSLIASEPGTGKTTLAIGLGLSVALGKSMLAGFTPNRRGRVTLFLAEDGERPSSQRIKAWCLRHGITREVYEAAVNAGWFSATFGDSAQLLEFSGGSCRRTTAFEELKERCRTEKYDMVVVDSLIEWAGCPEENSNSMMQQAAKCLIDLARESGGAVVALHHTNKSSDKHGAVGLHAIRGGSALAGKVRWAAQLSNLMDDEAKRFGIDTADRWRYLRFDVVKSQYAPRPGQSLYFERGDGGTMETVPLSTVAANSIDLLPVVVAALKEMRVRLTAYDIERKVGDFAIKLRQKIDEKAGRSVSNPDVRRAIEQGIEAGLLCAEPQDCRGPKKYHILPVNDA